jgi:hypothetical protein
MRPVIGTSTICGASCSAIVIPTATASPSVSSVSTTQLCAVACIHAPTFDTSPVKNQSRKLWLASERNVRLIRGAG